MTMKLEMLANNKPLNNRNALNAFANILNSSSNPLMGQEWDNETSKAFELRIRNLMALIQATGEYLNKLLFNFVLLVNGDSVQMDDVMKSYVNELCRVELKSREMQSELSELNKKSSRFFSSDKDKSYANQQGNYFVIRDLLQIGFDCKTDGKFNDNGKILVSMPEALFNTLRLPKYSIKQMEVYGSIEDRVKKDNFK